MGGCQYCRVCPRNGKHSPQLTLHMHTVGTNEHKTLGDWLQQHTQPHQGKMQVCDSFTVLWKPWSSKYACKCMSKAYVRQITFILLQPGFCRCNVPGSYQAADSFGTTAFVSSKPLL